MANGKSRRHQLGNYRLLHLLGQGGFAEVYLGEHVYLETQAAIKVLLTQLVREDIEAFRTEARTIARLEHPHIVRVLDFGVEGGTPFLVMNYATGGTLRQHHPRGTRLTLPLVVSYVQQVASALQYAHEEKLIHRDVKPENILLGRHGEVLLSDFGIALVAQTSRHQLTQAPTGTVAYMAPEQIQGKPRPASDQYALGMVVYEWLSGTLPFTGSVLEVFGQHLHVPPAPLHEKVSGIPIAVEQVVMRTLAKDPKDRFASMHAFATALEQASQVEDADETIEGTGTRSASHQRTVLSQREPPTEFVAQPGESFLPTAFTLPPSVPPWPVVTDTPLDNQQIKPLPSPVASSSAWLASGDNPRPPSPETKTPVETVTTPPAPPNLPTPDRAGTGSIHRSRARVFILCGVLVLLILASVVGVVIVRSHTQASGTSQDLTGVAGSGSRFVAVGNGGTILTSPDGSTWTTQASGTAQSLLSGVAWSGSRFVAVGYGGTILTPTDL